MPATLFIVATPIGNLEDITLRALRVLKEADLIAAEDTRHTATLLRHYDIHTPTTSFHEHNEREKLAMLMARLQEGRRIALVSDAGTPGISDPGYRLVRAARDAGIRVEVIPGPSAVIAALVASGLPTDSFTFVGFPPIRSNARNEWLRRIATNPRTSVFFESPHRLRATLADLQGHVLPNRIVAVARELTKLHEHLVKGPISEVISTFDTAPRGEIAVVVEPDNRSNNLIEPPGDDRLSVEFHQLMASGDLTRRAAIQHLAEKHALSSRDIYTAIERVKKSVK